MEKIQDLLSLVANEKGLDFEEVKEAFKRSIIKTAKKILGDIDVDVEMEDKKLKIYQNFTVVNDDRALNEPEKYLYLDEARDFDENAQIGDKLRAELDLSKLGRSGAMALQREFEREITRLLENEIYRKLISKLNTIVSGEVIKVDNDENTYVELDGVRGVLPRRNRIKGEKFKVGDVLKALLKYVHFDNKKGITIELSRTSPKFLEKLIENAVPEVRDGLIKIHTSARIPGVRSKVAVSSLNPKIDPIGTIIGKNGVRINAISNELAGENIDVIEYSPQPEIFVARALSPAIVKSVKIDEKNGIAYVDVDPSEKAKAIGKNGVNITLASMLTKYKIELKSQEKSTDTSKLESLFKI
ncbi:transcription termination/antitermination protein NusA [Caminibacter mediatlanticus TB-2]|uniref:Transcription termination/antitermination protein NusA n=1 Tax=Caminibacter mediatlanticus TB-2 TaxID=391592 RepID=A0AAI9F3H2_9BACT|nr:transcription termination factor NusA [Caminibacter mediatlanticus]EDM24636.1 transcription elongation factor NusA [Caminibacter mediatlanticus TB-2]QCT95277.1 transcription termination/antitermination protein NusA [Caminibacter mediatlanticus TB-2]